MFVSRSGPGIFCLLILPVIAISSAAAQAPMPAPKAALLFHQCQTTSDDSVAMSSCAAIVQDNTETPNHRAIAYASLGYVALDRGEDDLATDNFNRALALDPNLDTAYSGRAVIEFRLTQYDLAIADAKRAIELNPQGHPEAYLLLGTLADRDGDHDARIAYMTKAISILPTYAAAYVGRGNGYRDEKKYDQALADFNKAISLQPSLAPVLKADFVIVYIERGDKFVQLGQYPRGIDDLSKALDLDSNNARALGDLADAYNAAAQYDKAVTIATRDIAVNPDYPFAYANRGIAYLHLGKDDLALVDLNKAIELGDNEFTTYFARGQVYQSQSNQAAALADFQKSLDMAPPDYPYRGNIQKAIESAKH